MRISTSVSQFDTFVTGTQGDKKEIQIIPVIQLILKNCSVNSFLPLPLASHWAGLPSLGLKKGSGMEDWTSPVS